MPTGRTEKPGKPDARSVPFEAHTYLRSPAMVAAFVEEAIEEGDARFVPIALRTAAASIGGMSVLAERTGLSRETLYRTLSKSGNPRLDTLSAILEAFGLRLSVEPIKPAKRATKSTPAAKKSSAPRTARPRR